MAPGALTLPTIQCQDGEAERWYEDEDSGGRWIDGVSPSTHDYCAPTSPDEEHFHTLLVEHLVEVHAPPMPCHAMEDRSADCGPTPTPTLPRFSIHHSVFGKHWGALWVCLAFPEMGGTSIETATNHPLTCLPIRAVVSSDSKSNSDFNSCRVAELL